ncbi:MAG TPA: hypothetical protein VN605_06625 [Thermoanaerobaculia bacterium]|nr:hypothetical protein [Thermoanaerobaculia bacterium]
MTQLVAIQDLVGARVRDTNGHVAGRVHTIRAERIGPRCVVHEFQLGRNAWLSRIGAGSRHLFGFEGEKGLLRVPWQQMDLTEPSKPRLRCTIEELKSMQSQLPPFEDEAPPRTAPSKGEP